MTDKYAWQADYAPCAVCGVLVRGSHTPEQCERWRAEADRRRLAHGWEVLAQMKRILELHAEGLRRSVISERLGVTRVTTWRRMRVLGLVDGRRK